MSNENIATTTTTSNLNSSTIVAALKGVGLEPTARKETQDEIHKRQLKIAAYNSEIIELEREIADLRSVLAAIPSDPLELKKAQEEMAARLLMGGAPVGVVNTTLIALYGKALPTRIRNVKSPPPDKKCPLSGKEQAWLLEVLPYGEMFSFADIRQRFYAKVAAEGGKFIPEKALKDAFDFVGIQMGANAQRGRNVEYFNANPTLE